MLIWLLLACRGDPQLAQLSEALQHYDAGRAAVEQGDWAGAAVSFAAASARHPESPTLLGWHALALMETGQDAAARALLDRAVANHPDVLDLRYNRAVLAARTGDLQRAAADLRYLYSQSLLDPTEAGEDPAFAPLAQDPALAALVPTPQIRLQGTGEAGAVLLGDRYTLELLIESLAGAPLTIENIGQQSTLLQHIRTVEDVLGEQGRWTQRLVTVEWRARAGGEESIGPWLVSGHGSTAVTDRFKVEVVVIGEQQGTPQPPAEAVLLPSQILGDAELPWAGRLPDGRGVVAFAPGTSLELNTEPVGALELRRKGQTLWLGQLFPADAPLTGTVLRGQEVLRTIDLAQGSG